MLVERGEDLTLAREVRDIGTCASAREFVSEFWGWKGRGRRRHITDEAERAPNDMVLDVIF